MDDAPKSSAIRRLTAVPAWLWILPAFLAGTAYVKTSFFPEAQGFGNARFHPVWLPVLLIASRYGFWPGIVTAASGTLFYLWSFNGRLASREEVLLFFLVAWLLGQFRDKTRKREDELSRALNEDRRKLEETSEALRRESALHESLKTHAIGHTASLGSLYAAASDLSSLDVPTIYRGALALLTDNLQALAGSVYERGDGRFHRVASTRENPPPETARVTDQDPMVARLLAGGETVGLHATLENASAAPSSPFTAIAPLKGTDGTIIGFIAVEEMDFLRHNAVTLRLLEHLAEWVSLSLSRAVLVRAGGAAFREDQRSGILPYEAFSLIARAARAGSSSSGIRGPSFQIRVRNLGHLSREAAGLAITALSALVQPDGKEGVILFRGRGTDEIYAWGPGLSEAEFADRLRETASRFEAIQQAGGKDAARLVLEIRPFDFRADEGGNAP